jgi:hypothetical protein
VQLSRSRRHNSGLPKRDETYTSRPTIAAGHPPLGAVGERSGLRPSEMTQECRVGARDNASRVRPTNTNESETRARLRVGFTHDPGGDRCTRHPSIPEQESIALAVTGRKPNTAG